MILLYHGHGMGGWARDGHGMGTGILQEKGWARDGHGWARDGHGWARTFYVLVCSSSAHPVPIRATSEPCHATSFHVVTPRGMFD